jgi:Na+/proline symporter
MEEAVKIYSSLEMADFVIIGIYLVLSVGLGLWYARRGTKDTEAYFAGSGAIPWWIAGTSLLVACFAADTPLWIGDIIYKRGLEGAWLYWAPAIGTAFFVMLIAPLWKRSGIMTDIEFLEFRYRGDAASVMRFLNSLFYSGFVSIMFMTLQTLSIVKILQKVVDWRGMEPLFSRLNEALPFIPEGFDWVKLTCIVLTIAFAGSYSIISGLWGVASSGALQFLITYVGSVILAFMAVTSIEGGVTGMVGQISAMQETWPQGADLNILPTGNVWGLPAMTLVALLLYRWVEQAGMGQYVAQRLIATKSPRTAAYTAMIWGIGFFAIVPLPWIITVIAAKVARPDIIRGDEAYPAMAMMLPVGLKGILVASMLAAFMSTYSSLMSWGSSYFVNDFYKRFLVRKKTEHHYVKIGQIFMAVMAIVAGILAFQQESLLGIIFTVLEFMVGYWTVMFARWIWWRVNAWAEVAALAGSIFFAMLIRIMNTICTQLNVTDSDNPLLQSIILPIAAWGAPENSEPCWGHRILFVGTGSLVLWIIVMLLTRKPDDAIVDAFYKKVQPPGFWGPVRKRLGMQAPYSLGTIIFCWVIMMLGIFCPLIGLIKLCLGNVVLGLPLTVVGAVAIILAVVKVKKMYPKEPGIQE